VPVYVALGNNDSDCGDYKLDAHSAFLAAVGEEVAKSFPAAERKGIVDSYAGGRVLQRAVAHGERAHAGARRSVYGGEVRDVWGKA